jgi:opacity protein-like surface antigen
MNILHNPNFPSFVKKALGQTNACGKTKLPRINSMQIRSSLVLAAALLFGTMTYAQDDHKIEITGNYSYIHANPQNNNIIPTFSLNGGGGSAAFYFSKYIGIQAEFEGYGSFTHNIVIPAGNPACNSESACLISAQGNLFTYNVGPIVKFRTGHFEPFVEAMFGGAHSNFYGNLYKDCVAGGCVNLHSSPSNNAFDFIIGGGIDIPVTSHIAIRPAQFDYVLTRFGNSLTAGNNNQSNFRYQAGVQFRF